MTWMKAAFAAAAMTAVTPAAAATLAVYDYSPAFPDPATDPYVDQHIDQQIREGLIHPLRAPIADNGTPLTTKVPLFSGFVPYTRPGTQIQTGAIYWLVTTAIEDGTVRWQIEIDRQTAYLGGYLPPSNETSSSSVISGRGRIGDSPILRQTYVQGGKMHVVVGYLEP